MRPAASFARECRHIEHDRIVRSMQRRQLVASNRMKSALWSSRCSLYQAFRSRVYVARLGSRQRQRSFQRLELIAQFGRRCGGICLTRNLQHLGLQLIDQRLQPGRAVSAPRNCLLLLGWCCRPEQSLGNRGHRRGRGDLGGERYDPHSGADDLGADTGIFIPCSRQRLPSAARAQVEFTIAFNKLVMIQAHVAAAGGIDPHSRSQGDHARPFRGSAHARQMQCNGPIYRHSAPGERIRCHQRRGTQPPLWRANFRREEVGR